MSQFLYLYRASADGRREAMGTPERAQQSMQRWMKWMGELEASGNLKSRGEPLEPSGKVMRGKERSVTDGPYVEAKDIVGGYSIVEARDLNHAVELSTGCPILDGDGSVEVRPLMQM